MRMLRCWVSCKSIVEFIAAVRLLTMKPIDAGCGACRRELQIKVAEYEDELIKVEQYFDEDDEKSEKLHAEISELKARLAELESDRALKGSAALEEWKKITQVSRTLNTFHLEISHL